MRQTMNDQLDPKKFPALKREADEGIVEERLIQLIEQMPEPYRSYVLARIEEEETGTMPMPPMAPLAPPPL